MHKILASLLVLSATFSALPAPCFATPCEDEVNAAGAGNLYVKSLINTNLRNLFVAKLILQGRLDRVNENAPATDRFASEVARRLRAMIQEATVYELLLNELSAAEAAVALATLDAKLLESMSTLAQNASAEYGLPESRRPKAFGNRAREVNRFDEDWERPLTSEDTGIGR